MNSARYWLAWRGGHCAVSPGPPAAMKASLPQPLGGLLRDSPQLSALFGDCLCQRKLLCPKSCLFLGSAHTHNWSTWSKNAASFPQFGTLLKVCPASELLIGLAEAFVETASQLSFSPCSTLLPSPSFHRCWYQGLPLNKMHCRCQCVSESASRGAQPATVRMKGNENRVKKLF